MSPRFRIESPHQRTPAVVLSSGGLDSATVLDLARQRHLGNIYTISFRYGQKHEAEIIAAGQLAATYGVREHKIVDLPNIFGGTESVLVASNELEMPQMSYQEIANTEGVSPTYVPFRNANLISMAVAYAMTVDASHVYAGMHGDDARGWAYPDCTPEFIGAMANAVYVGTYHKVRFVAPLQDMSKAEIVQLGFERGVPFGITLSCYEGKSPACGVCPTCVERIQAFKDNSLEDPIEYEIEVNWDEN